MFCCSGNTTPVRGPIILPWLTQQYTNLQPSKQNYPPIHPTIRQALLLATRRFARSAVASPKPSDCTVAKQLVYLSVGSLFTLPFGLALTDSTTDRPTDRPTRSLLPSAGTGLNQKWQHLELSGCTTCNKKKILGQRLTLSGS